MHHLQEDAVSWSSPAWKSHVASEDQRARWIGAVAFDPDRFVVSRCGKTFSKTLEADRIVDEDQATCRSCKVPKTADRPIRPYLRVVR